jgi:hypothetical protein
MRSASQNRTANLYALVTIALWFALAVPMWR